MHDFSRFFKECERAPRINELCNWFESTASGQSGYPVKNPQVERRLLKEDDDLDRFVDLLESRAGAFRHHYNASIPYRIDEDCRLGLAILQYSKLMSRSVLYRSLGTSDSSMARAVAEFAEGRVEALCCSPNTVDKRNFVAYGDPSHATFFRGPFHHLTEDMMNSRDDLAKFVPGFDIIHEDTTFQMYSPNRTEQVAFVIQCLRNDGIFICVEKFRHPSVEEYERRELQKDHGFKVRYFSRTDVVAKERDILKTMDKNQVTLDEMVTVLKNHFQHCYMTWNSGNFYTLAASNDLGNLKQFITILGEPAIPKEFMYEEKLPRPLF